MLSYIVATISAVMASGLMIPLLDISSLLFVLDLYYTFALPTLALNTFIILVYLSQPLVNWYKQKRETRALDTTRLEERPQRKVDFTPRKNPHPHDWMLPGDPNEQFDYENRHPNWNKPMVHTTPADNSATPTTIRHPVARLEPSRAPEGKKQLSPAEHARWAMAQKKLPELLNEPTFLTCTGGVMIPDRHQKQHYIRELAASTKLSLDDAEECLKANDWKFDVALRDFKRLAAIDELQRRSGLYIEVATMCLERNNWNLEFAIRHLQDLMAAGMLHSGLFAVQPNWGIQPVIVTTDHPIPTQAPPAITITPATKVDNNQILKQPTKAKRLELIEDMMANTRDYWRKFDPTKPEDTCPYSGEFQEDCKQLRHDIESIIEAVTLVGIWDEEMIPKKDASKYLLRQKWYRDLGEKIHQCASDERLYCRGAAEAMLRLDSLIPMSWGLEWK